MRSNRQTTTSRNLLLRLIVITATTAFLAESSYRLIYNEPSTFYTFLKKRNYGIPFSKPIEKEPLYQNKKQYLNNPCIKLLTQYKTICNKQQDTSVECTDLLNAYKQCESDYELQQKQKNFIIAEQMKNKQIGKE